MFQDSWTSTIFHQSLNLMYIYLIVHISGFISFGSCLINCFGITLMQCSCLLAGFSSKLVLWAIFEKSGYQGAGHCSMWYIGEVSGLCWLLCCCLLALWVGGWVVWWGCGALWRWDAGGAVLAWFQESVSVWSHLLVICHTSIIVVYSVLY